MVFCVDRDSGAVVEAMLLRTHNAEDMRAWCGGRLSTHEGERVLLVEDDPEPLLVRWGEWLVRRGDGRYSIHGAAVFPMLYRFHAVPPPAERRPWPLKAGV